MTMKRVNVAKLKEGLSSYLHHVQEGGEIVVTSHERPVARIVSYSSDDLVISSPTRPLSELIHLRGVTLGAGMPADHLLIEDRRRR